MESYEFLVVFVLMFSEIAASVQTKKLRLKIPGEDELEKLYANVMKTIPVEQVNALLPQILARHSSEDSKAEKKISLKSSPLKEEIPSKKSVEAITPTANPSAVNIALMDPTVYLTNKNKRYNHMESVKQREFMADKRFKIPQYRTQSKRNMTKTNARLFQKGNLRNSQESRKTKIFNRTGSSQAPVPSERNPSTSEGGPIINKHPTAALEYKSTLTKDPKMTVSEKRKKRQDDDILDSDSPTADSITDDSTQASPVHLFNAAVPTNNVEDQVINARSDDIGKNANEVAAVLPVKIESPVETSAGPSLTLVTKVPQAIQGVDKSTLPISVTNAVSTLPMQYLKTENPLARSQVGNLLVNLQRNLNDVTTPARQHGGLNLVALPEEQSTFVKLARVPVKILKSNNENTGGANLKSTITKEKTTQDEINVNALKSLQSKLTNIISKLEEKANKKEQEMKKKETKEKISKMMKMAKSGPSEDQLKFLKERLSRVLEKFKSKPAAGQPFTIGKEWSHFLDDKSVGQAGTAEASVDKNDQSSTSASEDQGNWPSIASQLLRKLNKAVLKLQERRVARALGKNAVMYFDFDEGKSSEHMVEDKSGHFNDATLSDQAYVSTRTYGSCGKALILNSGNLRYVEKYFKNKPTKAITLAMWVRTNATGYVRWFARDSGSSREFSTTTQYPLVRKNVWSHLCGTFNSSTGITRIYVDGELKAEKVNKREDAIPADFTPAGIGWKFGDDNLIAVDEVYMFSRALSENEVRDLYDDCEFNRMVLHYGFQKVNRTAGVVFDQSGLNNNGELMGDANILDSGCDKCGSCLALNAKGDPRLMIESSGFKHRPTKAISIAAWFNLNSTTGMHPLFEVTELITKAPVLDLHVADGKLHWKGKDKNQKTIFDLTTDQSVVPEGIWVHVLVTFDSVSGEAKIFVDGRQKASEKTVKKVPVGEDWGDIRVGGSSIGSQASGVLVDELVLYNWELDPLEISYVMKYCPDHPKLVSFTVHVPLK